MKYTITEYRPVKGVTSLWTVEVKIEWTRKILGIFPVKKEKWLSCGRDGEPRIYLSLFDAVMRKNGLLICNTKADADYKIKIFNATKKGTTLK